MCMFVCTCDQVGERRNSGYTSWRNVISFVPNKKNNIVKMENYSAVLSRVFIQSIRAGLEEKGSETIIWGTSQWFSRLNLCFWLKS